MQVFQVQKELDRINQEERLERAPEAGGHPAPTTGGGAEGGQGPAAEGGQRRAAERVRLEEQVLPVMLEAMWAANVLDIDSTVRCVCKKVR